MASSAPVSHDNSAPTAVPEVGQEISAPASENAAAVVPCPRCGGKLTNPEGLGWCPSCGYCRSLQEDAGKAALASPSPARPHSPLGIVEFLDLLGRLPFWLWALVGGITAIALVSVAANFLLPDDSLPRALWSTLQVGLGLIGLFVAQVWAFLCIAPHSDALSSKDIILAGRLWSMTFRQLPGTRRQVWLGGWSVTAMICAVCVVGGYSYWYQFYKPKKYASRNLIAAIAQAARGKGKDKSMEEVLEELTDAQGATDKKNETKTKVEKEDKRATVECVILGYVSEKDKERRKEVITSLVLASVLDDRLKYAGQVRRGIDERISDELLKRLAPLAQDQPFLPGLNVRGVNWVKPSVFCAVHQSGFDRDGHIVEPRFKEALADK